MKMFYVVEEQFVKVSDTESRLFNYSIREAFTTFMEAAEYVNDIFENHNRKNQWSACAGGPDEDLPIHSIVKRDVTGSVRIYVKQ